MFFKKKGKGEKALSAIMLKFSDRVISCYSLRIVSQWLS